MDKYTIFALNNQWKCCTWICESKFYESVLAKRTVCLRFYKISMNSGFVKLLESPRPPKISLFYRSCSALADGLECAKLSVCMCVWEFAVWGCVIAHGHIVWSRGGDFPTRTSEAILDYINRAKSLQGRPAERSSHNHSIIQRWCIYMYLFYYAIAIHFID